MDQEVILEDQKTDSLQEVIVEEEEYTIPTNCWAFDAVSKKLIVAKTVSRGRKIILSPKVAGG